MCRPPDIVGPGSKDEENDRLSGQDWTANAGDWRWSGPAPDAHVNKSLAGDASMLNAQEQALIRQFGQQRQAQEQGRRRVAQFSPYTARPAPGPQLSPFMQQALNQQMPVAAATANAGMSWLADRQMAAGQWPGAPGLTLAQPVSPVLAHGIPLGMGQFANMDGLFGHSTDNHEDDEDLDPKKFKRMMSNRASAKRSRQRRQERLDELEIVSAKLQVENSTVQRKLTEANERIKKFQDENAALQTELKKLKDMLEKGGEVCLPAALPDGPVATTKQDSCPHGSTTDKPSEPSSSRSPGPLGKRSHEQMAESKFQEDSSRQDNKRVAANNAASMEHQTPSSAVTGSSVKGSESPDTPNTRYKSATPEACHAPGHAVAGTEVSKVEAEEEIVLLDDELFSSFMDECFMGRPLEVSCKP